MRALLHQPQLLPAHLLSALMTTARVNELDVGVSVVRVVLDSWKLSAQLHVEGNPNVCQRAEITWVS